MIHSRHAKSIDNSIEQILKELNDNAKEFSLEECEQRANLYRGINIVVAKLITETLIEEEKKIE